MASHKFIQRIHETKLQVEAIAFRNALNFKNEQRIITNQNEIKHSLPSHRVQKRVQK